MPLRGALADLAGLGRLGLAVSGGGDSLALMHLVAEAGLPAAVATVDHRLRPEAEAEARAVARAAAGLGFAHATLVWDGRAAQGNVPDQARQARQRLLAEWARREGLACVVLAHTRDDVAETFLMRLARGAGVDGLSAMADRFEAHGVTFRRPLLGASRQDLRDYLRGRGLTWAEDPTNADPAYDRTRARAALAALAPLGLDAARLAEVAGHLAQAREALEAGARTLLREVVRRDCDGLALHLDAAALASAPRDLARRVLVALIHWAAPAYYAPRGAQVTGLLARLAAGQGGDLAGARFFTGRGGLWLMPIAAVPLADWQVDPAPEGLTLAELGAAGLAQMPQARATGLPARVLRRAPALWADGRVIAAPHAGLSAGFRIWRNSAQTVARIGGLSH